MMVTFSKLGQLGRLGNQLFQIASVIGIAIKNGQPYIFPEWGYSRYFKNFPGEVPRSSLSGFNKLTEPSPYYNEIQLAPEYNWDLVGYFQSWKYFDHCKEEIKKYLYFPTMDLKGVAVHVRRGDYLSKQHIHPVLPIEYYTEAMKHFKGEAFTIFSDDIEWCKENFKGKKIEFFEPNGNDWLDFSYMAGFDKFIIANSSYSFWPAYLSGSNNVIAPKTWVNGEDRDDRVPPEWIRL